MKTAILYIRVSTDEQADTGYSQRSQDEMLRRYCELNNISIKAVFFEDHSAKTFNRPEFQKMLLQLRKHKGMADLVLFTKWDRFSRNAGDAYGMINTLNKLGVEPQAVEQPLNLDIPENKMMLAFYLAAPEVENDRRALNVTVGMRRAIKEGRYMGIAPIGYRNRQADKKKWIEPDPKTSHFIRRIFEQIATGKYAAESVLKQMRQEGFSCSKNNFWNILRNPVYCGQLFLPAYKNEEAQIITGNHQPIISEALYYQVQDVLNAKKKTQRAKLTVDERFPLRGLVSCPECGRTLTASSSRGRKQYYDYYHCTAPCRCRFKAEAINEQIVAELCKWKPHPAVQQLYNLVLSEIYFENDQSRRLQLKEVREELTRLNNRKRDALEMRLAKELDADDYLIIKRECEAAISILENKLTDLTAAQVNMEPLIEQSLQLLSHIDKLYLQANAEGKRDIIGSIFPEKLIFDGHGYRTARINEAVRLIFSLGAAFSQNKKGQTSLSANLSHEVTPIAPFSNHFLHDLRKLTTLYHKLIAA